MASIYGIDFLLKILGVASVILADITMIMVIFICGTIESESLPNHNN